MRLLCLAAALLMGSSAFAAGPASDTTAAIALYQEKKNTEARVAFEQLIAADPQNAEAIHFLGKIALREKRTDDAISLHEKAVALSPENSAYFIALGDAYGRKASSASLFAKLSWAKKCQAALARAVELEPRSFTANAALIEFYRRAPSVAGGGLSKAYSQADSFKKTDLLGGTQLLVELYRSEGKFPEIFSVLDNTLKTHPSHYLLLIAYGRTAADSGQHLDRGVESLERCLALTPPARSPSHATAWFYLGQIRLKKNDPNAARLAFEAALQLEPAHREARTALDKLSNPAP